MRIFSRFDWEITLSVIIISFLSLLTIFSIDQKLANNQLSFLIIGLILYIFFANFDYKILEKFSFIFYLFSLFLLLLTFIFGQTTRGSIRWIKIGFLNFQASEFVKPLLILFFASYAAKANFSKIKDIFIFFLFFLVPSFLIFKQPDLGNSLVITAIWLFILIGAGMKKIYTLLAFVSSLPFISFFWRFLKPYQKQRITSFINPKLDSLGTGYHLLQAKITIGSGELLGRGLGGGTQSQLKFLPESQTDFIFASFAEKLGFLGASILLLLYFILLMRILVFAKKIQDSFGKLLCLGIFAMIFFQVVVNVGMNLGILPITGITLPLFSSGGSSLVAILISLGIGQNVSCFLKRKEMIEIR